MEFEKAKEVLKKAQELVNGTPDNKPAPKAPADQTLDIVTLSNGEKMIVLHSGPAPLYIFHEKNLIGQQLSFAKIEDMATYSYSGPTPTIRLSDLVTHTELLTAFSDASLGWNNLGKIWDNNISKLLGDEYPGEDPALDMAENKSSMGLAITTLQVAAENKKDVAPLHVVLNTNTNQGLIVGDAPIAPSLTAAFNKAGIAYVNRNNKTAEARIEKAIGKLTGKLKPEAKLFLRDAFGYRQDITSQPQKHEQPLSKLLVDKTIGPNFGKFVVKNKPAA